MRYKVRANLSYCVIDGHVVFLDIETDRYFRLHECIERSFIRYTSTDDHLDADVLALVERNILQPAQTSDGIASPVEIHEPSRSVMELPHQKTRSAIPLIPEVLAYVWTYRRRVRRQPLKDVLDNLARYRQRSTSPAFDAVQESQLLEHTNLFRRARLCIPIEPRCLLDSLALTSFLARRRLHANIVFGVTYEPFAAHCWVQVGDMVLNDTVGSAMTHTPIKVV